MAKSDTPVAFISGAGSGIGRATCLELASQGYVIVAADLNGSAAQATIKIIEDQGGTGSSTPVDVRVSADVKRIGALIESEYGRLDVAVNSAGITPRSVAVQDIDEDEWETVLSVNLVGVWRCMAMEIALMLKSGGGSIVNVSSRTGLSGSPGRASYSASKHGVIGLTRSAALELATQGIRVNSVCPGPIATSMLEAAGLVDRTILSRLGSSSAMNRIGEAEEVAAAICWLLGSTSSYVTGVELPVDGGHARPSSSAMS